MLLLGASPALAQKGGAVAAAGPGPDPCATGLNSNLSTVCQGGSATLSVNTGCFVGPYTYTWTPGQNISETITSNYQVVVNPLTTTTYSVTATSPNGPTLTFSKTITVTTNCCQATTLSNQQLTPVELTAATYTSSPFAGQPAGTYFHFGGSTLTLNGNTNYALPAGSVLLLEPDAEVVVGLNATLELNGATITANCNTMWRGIRVSDGAFRIDFHGVSLPGSPTTTPMRNRIMHSSNGITLEPATVWGFAEYQLTNTDFLHNYRGVYANRQGSVGYPGVVQDKIDRCTFDTDPAQMKAPYQVSGSNSYYADYHLRVAGNLDSQPQQGRRLQLWRTSFSHALTHIRSDVTQVSLAPKGCSFTDYYVAGIYAAPGLPASSGTAGLDVSSFTASGVTTASRFTLTTQGVPGTPQVNSALSTYAATLPDGRAGIVAQDLPVSAQNTTFEQTNPVEYAPTGLSPSYYPHAGISGGQLTAINNCVFQDLRVGIAHALPAGGTGTQITQNLFGDCGYGYRITNPSNVSITAANSGSVTLDCNTFQRINQTRVAGSAYYSIYVNANTHAKLNGSAGTNTLMKNKFDAGGYNASRFQAVYNANTILLTYSTYSDYFNSVVGPLSGPNVSNLTGNPNYPNNGTSCAPSGSNGLPRAAVTSTPSTAPRLEQNVPNPAQGHTVIQYRTPEKAQTASLLVRRGVDGKTVAILPVALDAQQYDLNLAAYPAGTYFYTLLVDGVPVATHRLVVQ